MKYEALVGGQAKLTPEALEKFKSPVYRKMLELTEAQYQQVLKVQDKLPTDPEELKKHQEKLYEEKLKQAAEDRDRERRLHERTAKATEETARNTRSENGGWWLKMGETMIFGKEPGKANTASK